MDWKKEVTLLEHVGKAGVDAIIPFADKIGDAVNTFSPGAGDAVSKIIKEIGKAEADAVQAGTPQGTGPQKLAQVVEAVGTDVASVLKARRQKASQASVADSVSKVVDALNSFTVPEVQSSSSALPENVTTGDLAERAGKPPQTGG